MYVFFGQPAVLSLPVDPTKLADLAQLATLTLTVETDLLFGKIRFLRIPES